MATRGVRTYANSTPWLARLIWVFACLALLLWLFPLLEAPSTPVLFPSGPNFADITVYKGRFTLFHTAAFFRPNRFSAFAYPPGAAPIYELFYRSGDAVRTYLVLAAIAMVAAMGIAYRFLKREGLQRLFLPLLLLTYPLVFLVQRGNIELVLWVLVALGILAAARDLRVLAAFLFGLASAIKLYPIFLLGLFLRRKDDLPAFFTGVVTAAVALCASIAYAGPTFGVAVHGFFTGVGRFQDHNVDNVRFNDRAFDHCLLSPLKLWLSAEHVRTSNFLTLYYLAAGALTLLLFLRVRSLPFLNRLLFLVVAMVLLPPVSYAYTLTHLMLPALLLACALTFPRAPAAAKFALWLCLAVLLPLNGLSAVYPIPAGATQSVMLLCLLLLAAAQPWPETTAG